MVKIAWDTIPPEMIKKSFQKCCISNALDGTEDDIIFDSDNELGGDEDSEMDIYDDISPMN